MSEISKALELAIKAHYGQKDKGGNDYILHPITVALHCDTKQEKIVALLHDVVEDSNVKLDDLREFGDEIVCAVNAITKKDGQTLNEYLECVKANNIARKVKIQDLTHNMDLSRIINPCEKDYQRVEKYQQELEYLINDTRIKKIF